MPTLLDQYYAKQPAPVQSCLLALKNIVLAIDKNITHQRKFQIPFFYFNNKKLCFLWVTRKKLLFGFVEDKSLFATDAHVKPKDRIETITINPDEDLPVESIETRLKHIIHLYIKNG